MRTRRHIVTKLRVCLIVVVFALAGYSGRANAGSACETPVGIDFPGSTFAGVGLSAERLLR